MVISGLGIARVGPFRRYAAIPLSARVEGEVEEEAEAEEEEAAAGDEDVAGVAATEEAGEVRATTHTHRNWTGAKFMT